MKNFLAFCYFFILLENGHLLETPTLVYDKNARVSKPLSEMLKTEGRIMFFLKK